MPNSIMSWRWLHDCFVYLLHRLLTGHTVSLDLRSDPAEPVCLTCGK